MSKRFYRAVIVVCSLCIVAGIFVYLKKFSAQSREVFVSDTILVAKELESIGEVVASSSERNIEEKKSRSHSLTLIAFGDIMLDRSVMLKTQASGDYNYPFLLIDPLLKKYNLHLANLEGPITTNKSIANGTGGARFTFTFSPKFVEPLKNRFEFLSLANNHEYNFGQSGIDQTRKFLGDSGVKYFGDPNNIQNFLSVTTSYNNITFGFVGYHQLIEKGFEDIIAETKKLDTEVDVLVAMPHWGIEYAADTPSYLQKKEAHEMIDAGVDLIIGAHPHVVEPIEIYKEKVIFYSLGNFIFDQYFSEETMTGLAVGMKIEKDDTEKLNITYSLIPLDISKQSQASVAESPKKEKVLNHLYKFSQVDDLVKDAIKDGEFENHYSLHQ